MIQARRHTIVITAVLLALGGGCGDKKKKEQASVDKPSLASVEGLQAVPANASAVIGLDMAKLVASPVVRRAVERVFAQDVSLREDLGAVLEACKIDLSKDISAATIALLPRGEHTDSLLVAKGQLEESALTACLGRFLSESGGRLESAEFNGRALYHQVQADDPNGIWLSFGSKDTLLVASAREALEASLGEGQKLADAKTGLARFASRANTKAAIWAMAEIDAAVGEGLVAATNGQVKPAQSILGSVDLGEAGMSLALEVQMVSEADAKTLISQASIQVQGMALVLQIDAIGPLLKKLQLGTDGRWATLGWQLSEQELADLMGANMRGLSSTIDNNGANEQNPAPKSEQEGNAEHGNRNPDAGNEKDLRQQGQAR
jgi:hypothetical protein